MTVLIWTLAALAGSGVNNPGGERIPFVKLRSASWDVVIRKTGGNRARLERVRAYCDGQWINACAPDVNPAVRQDGLSAVFQEGVTLTGDFSYCSTAVVQKLPENLGRELIRPQTGEFCRRFLNPSASLSAASATQGENDLVNRLMGGQNTTSGQVRMKKPAVQEGTRTGVYDGPATVPSVAVQGQGAAPVAPVPMPMPQPEAVAPAGIALDDADPVMFEAPAPAPAPEPDPELDALLAPVPTVAPAPTPLPMPAPAPAPVVAAPTPAPSPPPAMASVVVPAPAPLPARPAKGPSEFDLEAMETENLERLSDRGDEDDGKKKKKKKKDKGESAEEDMGESFDDFIIIDIESLEDE